METDQESPVLDLIEIRKLIVELARTTALPNTRCSHRATKELEKTPGIRNAKCRRQASPWENLISGTTRYQWPKFSQASLVSSRGPECDLFSFAKLCIHSLTLELCDCLAFVSLADCVSSSYDVSSCGHQGAWRAAIDSVSLPILKVKER